MNTVEPELVAPSLLPDTFLRWFAGRGWSPREHQLELLAKARDDRSALLIAPTGAGKTLAGFLPTLVELFSPSLRAGSEASEARSRGRGGGYSQTPPVQLPLTRQPAAVDLSHKGRGKKQLLASTQK